MLLRRRNLLWQFLSVRKFTSFQYQFKERFDSYVKNLESIDSVKSQRFFEEIRQNLEAFDDGKVLLSVIVGNYRYNLAMDKELERNLALRLINQQRKSGGLLDGGSFLVQCFTTFAIFKILSREIGNGLIEFTVSEDSGLTSENTLRLIEILVQNPQLHDSIRAQDTETCLKIIEKLIKLRDRSEGLRTVNMIIFIFSHGLFGAREKEAIAKKLYQIILQVISEQLEGLQNTTTLNSGEILKVTLVVNSLQILVRTVRNADVLILFKKLAQVYQFKLGKADFTQPSQIDPHVVCDFCKNFLNSRPAVPVGKLCALVQSAFAQELQHQEADPNHTLDELIPAFYFLAQNQEGYSASYEFRQLLVAAAPTYRNLFYLAKVVEALSFTHEKDASLLALLEDRVVALSRLSANPGKPLLLLFSALAQLGAGKAETWGYLVEYFTYPKIIGGSLGLTEAVQTLLPALSGATKNLFGKSQESQKVRPDQKLREAFEFFWDRLEAYLVQHVEKLDARSLPSLFVSFSYSNLAKSKERSILKILKTKILENFTTYPLRELSQFILSYSKLSEQQLQSEGVDEFVRKIDEKVRASLSALEPQDLINLFSAYANFAHDSSGLSAQLYERLQSRLKRLSNDNLVQLIYALGGHQKKFKLFQDTKLLEAELLDRLSSQKIQVTRDLLLGYALIKIQSTSKFEATWNLITDQLLREESKISESYSLLNYINMIYINIVSNKDYSLTHKDLFEKFVQSQNELRKNQMQAWNVQK